MLRISVCCKQETWLSARKNTWNKKPRSEIIFINSLFLCTHTVYSAHSRGVFTGGVIGPQPPSSVKSMVSRGFLGSNGEWNPPYKKQHPPPGEIPEYAPEFKHINNTLAAFRRGWVHICHALYSVFFEHSVLQTLFRHTQGYKARKVNRCCVFSAYQCCIRGGLKQFIFKIFIIHIIVFCNQNI